MDSLKKSLRDYYEKQIEINEIRIKYLENLITTNTNKGGDLNHKKSLLINQIELEYLINKIEALRKTIQKI